MSVLSEQDIIKALGKSIKNLDEGILIYPFKKDNLVGSCLWLTASKYAYSLHKKKLLGETDGKPFNASQNHFFFPSGDTVLVYTNESVFISKYFCGSIHSKVGLASKGIGHIGTKVNPNWSGIFSIALHNLSGRDLEINTDEIIAYLRFYKLSSESSSPPEFDSSARLDVIPGDHPQELVEWINEKQSRWRKGSKEALQTALKDVVNSDSSLEDIFKDEEESDEKDEEKSNKSFVRKLINFTKSVPSKLNRFYSEYLFLVLSIVIIILLYLLAGPENTNNFIVWLKGIDFKDWIKSLKDIIEIFSAAFL